MKKKTLIAAAVVLVLGLCAVLFSKFARQRSSDMMHLTDDSLGQTVTVDISEPLPVNRNSWLLGFEDDENAVEIRVLLTDAFARTFERYVEQNVPVTGIIRKSTPEMFEEDCQTIIDYVQMLSEVSDDFGEITDDYIASLRSCISPYYIEATALNNDSFAAVKQGVFIAGIVLLIVGGILLIAALLRRSAWKVALACICIVAVPALIVGIVFFRKLQTVFSIRGDSSGMYCMEYTEDAKLAELLNANITSDSDLLAFLQKEELCGLPVDLKTGQSGCAAFEAAAADGTVLFGRNFDYPETDTLMIFCDPKNAYASYALADLREIGISTRRGKIDPDSPLGRFVMLAAHYVVTDGFNEAGLGVATLQLDNGEIHQNTGKPDLFVYCAVRVLLDRCATVDDALSLLEAYDIHSHNGNRQHLFIVDKTGRSVVVEWSDSEMFVNELDACTNSVLTPGDDYGAGADDRLPTILAALQEHDGTLSRDEARDLLAAVAQEDYTEWSCVYDLNRFAVDVWLDEHFDQPYHFGSEE
jgi:hypothetical protein